jgi:hypothetical protein
MPPTNKIPAAPVPRSGRKYFFHDFIVAAEGNIFKRDFDAGRGVRTTAGKSGETIREIN